MEGSWLTDFIIGYLKSHSRELILPVLKGVMIPYLKEQASKTSNKFDDYGVKQLERIVSDPEFLALLEGIG